MQIRRFGQVRQLGGEGGGGGGGGGVPSTVILAGGTSFSHKAFLKFGQSHFLKMY